MKFATQYDPLPHARRGERISDKPSQTIPGKARDLKTLVERMINGLDAVEANGVYLDPGDVELVNRFHRKALDLTDLDELRMYNAQIQDRLDKYKTAKDAEPEPEPQPKPKPNAKAKPEPELSPEPKPET